MKELQEKLLSYLGKGEELIEQAWMAGQEQIPLLIQEILIFKGVEALLLAAIWLAISVIGPILLWKLSVKLTSVDPHGDWYLMNVFSLVFILSFVWGAVDYARDALQIWLAPRLYLIEYAADLVRPVSGS